MLCPYPSQLDKKFVPCGRCIACRVNKKREWVGRLHLENLYNGPASFVTLTYSDGFLPKDGSLDPLDWKRFYDRLRKQSGIGAVRYFMSGEYGDERGRPHFHALLFGVPPTPEYQERIRAAWAQSSRKGQKVSMGHVDVGLVAPGSIDYVASYTIKKLNGPKGAEVYGDRYPPFIRMSRRPPIGAAGFARILQGLYTRSGAYALAERGDVPNRYRVNQRVYPVPQYFIDRWREELGIEKPSWQPWEFLIDEASKDRQQAARAAAREIERRKRLKAGKSKMVRSVER